jgi:ribonuclease BN (tRNA processing enzyme)
VIDGITVTALRNHHPPIRESFAYRLDFTDEAGASRRVVFSGDTAMLPEMVAFADGADLLVHEAMYGPGVEALVARVPNSTRLREHLHASHTLAEDVGRIATAARVKHLALNHLVPADDPAVTASHWEAAVRQTWAGPLAVGRDGLVIEI